MSTEETICLAKKNIVPSHAVLQPDWVQLHQPYGWHVSTDESNCHFHSLDSRTINRSEGVLSHLFLWLMLHGSQNTHCVPIQDCKFHFK